MFRQDLESGYVSYYLITKVVVLQRLNVGFAFSNCTLVSVQIHNFLDINV